METNRKYKDTLFSELFNQPQNLRELYNALAGTNYGEDTPIEINTLENVFFNDLKNDVSFTIGGKYVVLLEHQSTISANMPLRCLMYIARILEKMINERAIYREKLLQIPTPEFIVLYNGEKPFPKEKTLRLSDAYLGNDKSHKGFGSLDLTVRVVNINPKVNGGLLKKSEALGDYSTFIEQVRHNKRRGLLPSDAIKEAIKWGVSQGLLGEYLKEHGAEVTSMLYTEFNIDIAKEVWQEEAREDGYEEGLAAAKKRFEAELEAKDKELAKLKELVSQLQKNSSNEE